MVHLDQYKILSALSFCDSPLWVQYVKSWFWLDILSSIPVDYIFLILDSGILDTEEVKICLISFILTFIFPIPNPSRNSADGEYLF